MKRTTLLLLAAVCAGTLYSCSGSQSAPTTDSTARTDSTQTTTIKTDSGTTAAADTAFANKAAIGGMAEVALGKMAASKGASSQIKDFGNMMVMDHGKANDELKSIAQKKNIQLPAGLDAEHQAKSDSLSKLSGKDFDKAYAQAMVEGHKKTLALMKEEAANGQDADLKAFAAKTAPVVEMHLNEIMKIQSGLK